MIKNLLLASLISLTPYKIVWNINDYTFQKNTKQTYIGSGQSNQEWGNYAYVNSETYNVLNNSFEVQTTIVRQMEIDNQRHDIRVKTFIFNDNISNGTKFDIQANYQCLIENGNDTNLTEFIVGSMILDKNSWESEYNTVKTALNTKYTDPWYIRDQITTCHNACMSTGNYDDTYSDISKSDYPNDFYSRINNLINYLENNNYSWQNEDNNSNFLFAEVLYIEMRFNFEGTYNNLATTTKQSLYDSLNNIENEKNIRIKTEQVPITVSGDIVDIPGLIFTVLGMPFAWFGTAFNLTLFPGTPYALNVANLLLGVIGLLVAIFIIRKLLK